MLLDIIANVALYDYTYIANFITNNSQVADAVVNLVYISISSYY